MKAFIKRAIDLIGSLIGLIVLSPAFILISLLILLNMGTPIIFKQQRPGLKGKIFTMYKFRTMKDDKDSNGNQLPDNVRLTKLGKFLRNTSLDELPGLLNVIKGEMSLVGPRPLAVSYLDRYSAEQKRRHDVKPGITGWAQVNGRNNLSWEKRFRLDVWYVDNHNLFIDFKIIFMTLIKVLKRDGVKVEGQAEVKSFLGNSNKRSDIDG